MTHQQLGIQARLRAGAINVRAAEIAIRTLKQRLFKV